MMPLLRRLFGEEYPDRYETWAEYVANNSTDKLLERAAIALAFIALLPLLLALILVIVEEAAK